MPDFYPIARSFGVPFVVFGRQGIENAQLGQRKGLIWIKGEISDKQTDWCRRVIATQGGIVAEPVYDKQTDLAMEFSANRGTVTFECYSLFESASSGAYAGNRLLTDKQFENEASKFIDVPVLYRLREQLANRLAEYFPNTKARWVWT